VLADLGRSLKCIESLNTVRANEGGVTSSKIGEARICSANELLREIHCVRWVSRCANLHNLITTYLAYVCLKAFDAETAKHKLELERSETSPK